MELQEVEQTVVDTTYNDKGYMIGQTVSVYRAIPTEDHVAMRGDEVDAWLTRWRDQWEDDEPEYQVLTEVIVDYRLHADTGTPLSLPVHEADIGG